MPYLFLMGELGADRIVPVEGDRFVIGRDEGCDLQVLDVRISRRHAELRRSSAGWTVADLGSRNGITINQARLRSSGLRGGELLGVGPLAMRFEVDGLGARRASVIDRGAVDTLLAGGSLAGGEPESQRRLRLLLEISAALDSLPSPDELLCRFGELVMRLFSPSRCMVTLGDKVWCSEGDQPGENPGEPIEAVETVAKRVRERGEALIVRDLLDTQQGQAPKTDLRCAMGAPILSGDRVVGLAYVDQHQGEGQPFGQEELHLLIVVGRLISAAATSSLRFERLLAQSRYRRATHGEPGAIVGQSPAVRELRETIATRVGPVRATVLLTGETGTGKTMVAEAIHFASAREGPFLKVNCAAIPKELLESELFGYEKGAFSGANRRKLGLFEAAHGGTLFLDEVGELDPAAQAKLLTAVQDRQVVRLGASQPVTVDVRLLAATNRDLKQDVQQGTFRADLYYRLNVVTLTVPPLRERREDIPLLAEHLLARASHEIGRSLTGITDEAVARLCAYSWPGNVRELANCIERSVIFGESGESLGVDLLPEELQEPLATEQTQPSAPEDEREIITRALQLAEGNKRQAARLLGWYPQKLYHRLKRYGIEVKPGSQS
jgi:Nif-specific regulatory protein